MPTFSAALLAGGASRRMGRDKALLPIPGSDQLLWQRQWRVLEDLKPDELLWSGPPRPGMPANARIIPDLAANAGPLAGIAACLQATPSDLLVILAVDLPEMTASFLRQLLAQSSKTRGAVIQHSDYFEPLAAIYPRHLHALATAHLAQGRHALQDFVRTAAQQQAVTIVPLKETDTALFQNWNSPFDVQ